MAFTDDPLNLITNTSDTTDQDNSHAANHNAANAALNDLHDEYVLNAIRKHLPAILEDYLQVEQKTFMGRSGNPSNVYDPAVLEIDARTPGQAAGTAGMWILANQDGTPAIKIHCEQDIGTALFYASHPNGGIMLKNNLNLPVNNWTFYTVDTNGVFQVRFEIPAGVTAGEALIDSPEAARFQGGLFVGGGYHAVGNIRNGSAVYNPGSVADNDHSVPVSVTVTGAVVNDPAFASFSSITAAGWEVHATVIAANTVSVHLVNRTGSAADLPEGTVRAVTFGGLAVY